MGVRHPRDGCRSGGNALVSNKDQHSFATKLMEELIVPTFVLDATGTIIIWNKALERLTGLAADDMIGTQEHWRGFYETPRACLADVFLEGNTDDLDALYASHSEAEVHSGFKAENWCVMPRASLRVYLAINAGPIYDEQGKLIAVVETLRDMTDQKKAEDTLRLMANMDKLTGLANRRVFDEALSECLEQARTAKTSLALILGDIDHFKLYNDHYGHQGGDECLTQVAKAIKEAVGRPMDVTARYGGEEFAVILPSIEAKGAMQVAERILKKISEQNIPHATSTAADHVTMSLGVVALVPDENVSEKDMINWADKALYQAKENGRNQVCLQSDD